MVTATAGSLETLPGQLPQLRAACSVVHLARTSLRKVLEHVGAVRLWREIFLNLVIKITFIVRFPCETEAEIAGLLDWLHEARIDRFGAFTYSPLEDAPANDIAAHVLPEV